MLSLKFTEQSEYWNIARDWGSTKRFLDQPSYFRYTVLKRIILEFLFDTFSSIIFKYNALQFSIAD